jgi:hypothetical protein
VSAHRRDEYLQAARVAIDPAGVEIELDLTPGIALAGAIVADIDRDRDGTLSLGEQQAYAGVVLGALHLDVDGRPAGLRLRAASFPDIPSMTRGEGTIRLNTAATLPRLAVGQHRLLFRNGHQPDRSVYLANALVPGTDSVAITAQGRDPGQRELAIDYVLHTAPAAAPVPWLIASIAAAGVIAVLLARRLRATAATAGRTGAYAPPLRRKSRFASRSDLSMRVSPGRFTIRSPGRNSTSSR